MATTTKSPWRVRIADAILRLAVKLRILRKTITPEEQAALGKLPPPKETQ
jgi:hypothetical protein